VSVETVDDAASAGVPGTVAGVHEIRGADQMVADQLLLESTDDEPPPPRPRLLEPTTGLGWARRTLWCVAGVASLLLSYGLVGGLLGGGLAGFGSTEPSDGVSTGATVGALVGVVASLEWLWRRARHESFEVLRGPDGIARWAGDPAGAAVGWWLPWIAVGGPLLIVVTGLAALWDVVRRGDPDAGQLLRRGLLALLVAGGALGGGGYLLGDRWDGPIHGAVAGGVLAVVLVGLPWALPAARRYASPWFPMRRLQPGLDVRVARANGDEVAEPRRSSLLTTAVGGLVAVAVLAVFTLAAVGWVDGAEEGSTAAPTEEAVVEEPAPTTTVPTTAPYPPALASGVVLTDEVTVDQGTYRLQDPLAGYGLWCHVIAVYPSESIDVDPTTFVLIDPSGGWHAPVLDLGTPRASRSAITLDAGETGEVEACFGLEAGAQPGRWGLVGMPGGEDAALFATLDAADAPPPTTTTTAPATTTTTEEPTSTTAAPPATEAPPVTETPPASTDPPAV
jgi:hypothetical protein